MDRYTYLCHFGRHNATDILSFENLELLYTKEYIGIN